MCDSNARARVHTAATAALAAPHPPHSDLCVACDGSGELFRGNHDKPAKTVARTSGRRQQRPGNGLSLLSARH